MVWITFAIFLAACFAAGTTGAIFPPGEWYRQLSKPSWTPPDWMFPVAWTTLYICMAAAGARVAVSDDNAIAMALWALAFWLYRADWIALLALIPAAGHLAWQIATLDESDPDNPLARFRSNRWTGALVAAACFVVGNA